MRVGKLPRSDVPIYFLEYNRYFDRPYLYGPPSQGYPDNLERFTFLSRGALEICKALGFIPDVVHCNDWQTALVPVYLNTVEWAQPLHGAASIYSIHNLAYQGVLESGALFITGLGREHYNPGEFEHFGALNLTKAALYHSTLLTTVSPTYAREIQTGAYGCGLDGVLRGAQRRPARDPERHRRRRVEPGDRSAPPRARTTRADLGGKAKCKAALQKEAGLPVRPDVPLFGVVGRLTTQKGVRRAGARAGSRSCAGTCRSCCSAPAIPRPSEFFAARARTSAATAFAPGSASTTGAPTASRPAATSS